MVALEMPSEGEPLLDAVELVNSLDYLQHIPQQGRSLLA